MSGTRPSAVLFGVGVAGTLAAFFFAHGGDHQASLVPMAAAHRTSPRAIAVRAFPSVVQLGLRDGTGNIICVASGFFVAPGIVVTSAHVVDGAVGGDAKRVGDEVRYEITGVVALDAEYDLALVRIAGAVGTPLVIGDDEAVAVGDEVFAIGSAGGYEGTFSQGLVSGIRRTASRRLLQITAPMSHGSSGGPILDARGDVIGVASALVERGQNLNFASPASALKPLLARLSASAPLAAGWPVLQSRTNLAEGSEPSSPGATRTAAMWLTPRYER